ncbi:MAG: class I SAM-dependent methyltransferase [Desulfitobacteriaceae bacterium]
MKEIKVGELQFLFSKRPAFREKSELLDNYWIFHPRYQFFKTTPRNGRLLDVGAGSGGLSYWKTWNIPRRDDILMYAIDLKKGEFEKEYEEFDICNLDRERINKPEGYFNRIIVSHVLEHIENKFEVMHELNRVLKLKGRIYIEIPTSATLDYPNRDYFLNKGINVSTVNFFDDKSHIGTLDTKSLIQLCTSSNFRVIESGIIDNKFIENDLFSFGLENNDQETITYGLWSQLQWAHYVIGEKV